MRATLPAMNRILLVAAVLLFGAAPAQAGVKSHKVNESAESVRAYWTEERMRTAVPAERARAGEPPRARAKPGGSSSWSTLKVDWATAPPELRAHGKVYFTEGGTNYVCSGTAVQSASESVVWTAGHCLDDGNGNPASKWSFVPAYNSGVDYGTWVATSLHTTSAWAQPGGDDFGQDLGAAKVGLLNGATLQDTVGARPLATGTLALNTRVISYGYPAAGKYNGQSMYACDSYVSRYDSNFTPKTYGIPCGMTGGSSGGGWIAGGSLVSVNSYGYGSLKNVMFGPQHGANATSLLTAADSGS